MRSLDRDPSNPWIHAGIDVSNNAFTEVVPDAGSLRNLTTSELRWALMKEPALSLRLGVENEYETNPDEGDDPNTLNYYFTMGIDF